MRKTPLLLALVLAGSSALAQTPATSAAPAAPTTAPAASGTKKELVARILKFQQPGIEAMARGLAEAPAAGLMERAGAILQTRVPADKRQAVARELEGDLKKYLDDAVPMVQARALKLAPTTVGTVLESRFTEDELRQIVGIIESPAYAKFQQLGGDMQNALAEKLVAELRPSIDPKITALEQSLTKRLGVQAAAPAAGGAPARPPAQGSGNR